MTEMYTRTYALAGILACMLVFQGCRDDDFAPYENWSENISIPIFADIFDAQNKVIR